MTYQEAANIIKDIEVIECPKTEEAYRLAIEALENRKQIIITKWIDVSNEDYINSDIKVRCSNCDCFSDNMTHYCPHCGAEMINIEGDDIPYEKR